MMNWRMIPLFCFFVSTKHEGPYLVSAMLSFMEFASSFGLSPLVSHTDKDSAQITALEQAWPHGRILLCHVHMAKSVDGALHGKGVGKRLSFYILDF